MFEDSLRSFCGGSNDYLYHVLDAVVVDVDVGLTCSDGCHHTVFYRSGSRVFGYDRTICGVNSNVAVKTAFDSDDRKSALFAYCKI